MRQTCHGDYERRVRFSTISDYDVKIVFCRDLGEARKARYGTPGSSDNARGLHTKAVGGISHLFFKLGDCPTGVIAHECWHAIHAMFEWAGVQDFENELVAYHLGYLVQKVADFRNALIDSGVKSSTKKR